MRALFIDDEAQKAQSSANNYLEELYSNPEQFTVTVQISVSEAIDYIRGVSRKDEPEDLVVLDIMMPVEDLEDLTAMEVGYYILRHHLRHPESAYRTTPVLILTNKDRDEVQRRVEGIGGV